MMYLALVFDLNISSHGSKYYVGNGERKEVNRKRDSTKKLPLAMEYLCPTQIHKLTPNNHCDSVQRRDP